jgi:hypothetical protein
MSYLSIMFITTSCGNTSYARVVPAFEEIDVVEQASGEEQSPVGSVPDVRVVEPELVVSSAQGKPWCI